MKIQTSDCLHILRRFEVASDDDVAKDVSRLHVTHPRPINTLADFRFKNTTYALFFDDTAEDDESYIINQVSLSLPGRDMSLLKNPQSDVVTHALPYEGKSVYLLQLDADKQRLDAYLAQTYPEYSRSSWQKYIKAGHVSVDDNVQTSPKFAIDNGSRVTVDLPDVPDHADRELPVVYMDDDIIVVNKPVGVLTHSKNQLDHEFTVADFFRRYTTHGLDADRPGVVHRLDRDTSGLVVGARTPESYEHLKQQFADRTVKKTYHAVVDGVPEHETTHVDLPITRNQSRPGSFMVAVDGKPAQTVVKLLESNNERSLLQLEPRTGRTHQLRVHLEHLGLPILGDRLYGAPADRLYLHASELEITLPSGEKKKFTAPLPPQFKDKVGKSH